MLDIKKIKENPDAVKAGLKAKEVDCDAVIDRILELDVQVRALKTSTETNYRIACAVNKRICGSLMPPFRGNSVAAYPIPPIFPGARPAPPLPWPVGTIAAIRRSYFPLPQRR